MSKHFEVIAEGRQGEPDSYVKGESRHLGFPLGPQTVETLSIGNDWVVITYDGGAETRIRPSRIISITKG